MREDEPALHVQLLLHGWQWDLEVGVERIKGLPDTTALPSQKLQGIQGSSFLCQKNRNIFQNHNNQNEFSNKLVFYKIYNQAELFKNAGKEKEKSPQTPTSLLSLLWLVIQRQKTPSASDSQSAPRGQDVKFWMEEEECAWGAAMSVWHQI